MISLLLVSMSAFNFRAIVLEAILLLFFIMVSLIIYNIYCRIKKYFKQRKCKTVTKQTTLLDGRDDSSAELWVNKRSVHREKEVLHLSIYRDLSRLMTDEKIYHNPRLTRDDVVSRLGTNRKVFMEALQNHVDMNFVEYINTYRLNEAISLLESEDFTNETIAEEVGFGSANTFYRQFRTKYGLSPYEYKKKLNEAFLQNQSRELQN